MIWGEGGSEERHYWILWAGGKEKGIGGSSEKEVAFELALDGQNLNMGKEDVSVDITVWGNSMINVWCFI